MKILNKLFNLNNRTVVLTGASGHLAEKFHHFSGSWSQLNINFEKNKLKK